MPLSQIWPILIGVASMAMSWALTRSSADRAIHKAEHVERDLAEFKVQAAGRFVTDEMLSKVESRIVEEIHRLGSRLDRLVDKGDH